MTPDFSEFSYGFAFTHEYINRNPGLKAAPELPSLIREAKKGYDLKLCTGHPKFFQFKLAEYLSRSNAIHWLDHHREHYRVRLSTRARQDQLPGSDQHSLLKHLSQTVDHVNYVAPMFHSETEFNELFHRREVTTNSLWAPLRDLPWADNDNDVHYLTFSRTHPDPIWHSETVNLEGHFHADDHYSTVRETIVIDEDYFRGLRDKLLVALSEAGDIAPRFLNISDEIADVLVDTHHLLTVRFGLQMVTLVQDNA